MSTQDIMVIKTLLKVILGKAPPASRPSMPAKGLVPNPAALLYSARSAAQAVSSAAVAVCLVKVGRKVTAGI